MYLLARFCVGIAGWSSQSSSDLSAGLGLRPQQSGLNRICLLLADRLLYPRFARGVPAEHPNLLHLFFFVDVEDPLFA